jgi:hypothetical protein
MALSKIVNLSVTLADDRAMSQESSPFKSIKSIKKEKTNKKLQLSFKEFKEMKNKIKNEI